jgi:predicted AlkP superfamily pyrophosphatase or phosphodiesterase
MSKGFLNSCLLIFITASSIVAADRPNNRILLIGIDGCRTDALLAANPTNLKRLIDQGAFSDATNILGTRTDNADTVSGPGWSNILTGVWADKHGVVNNELKVKHYDKYPHFFVHVKEVYRGAHTHSYCVWRSIDTHIVAGADESICFARDGRSEPDCAADSRCAAKAVDVLKSADSDVMFVYFENVDATGHLKGFHRSVPRNQVNLFEFSLRHFYRKIWTASMAWLASMQIESRKDHAVIDSNSCGPTRQFHVYVNLPRHRGQFVSISTLVCVPAEPTLIVSPDTSIYMNRPVVRRNSSILRPNSGKTFQFWRLTPKTLPTCTWPIS